MSRIAVIEDDEHIGNILEEALLREGYEVSRAYSGTEAVYLLAEAKVDLVLLDLMLPGMSGEELLGRIGEMQAASEIPVIVVSAKAGTDDKVDALLGGAVDYVTKPFEIRELMARIAVQLRKGNAKRDDAGGMESSSADGGGQASVVGRGGKTGSVAGGDRYAYSGSERISSGTLTLHADLREVVAEGVSVHLTRTECAILKVLLGNAGRVIAKSVLLDRISEDTPDCTEDSLKQHISNLKKKLRSAGGREYIETVWGIGFKLDIVS